MNEPTPWPPETDRKAMLPASFLVMLLIWMLCVTILVFIGLPAFGSDTFVSTAVRRHGSISCP